MSDFYVVDGKIVSKAEFLEMQKDKNIKLKLVEGVGKTNEYKTLKKLLG